jgi:ubiquinone biosynthesis protein
VITDLGLDRDVVDPTTLSADELVNEIQRTIKALLGIGARLPKELMLFIKNMVFLDGAIATLAPDLDILGEIGQVSMHFAQQHGERLAAELGMDGDAYELDLTGMKASFGLDASVEGITYRELQQRREIIRDRLQKHDRKAAKHK